ncbi:hypothetical protein JYK21_06785, partial [Ralstonia pickettii]|nr:hypothetical protein [Ralstonia pickettii]
MSYHDNSDFDDQLNKIEGDVNWREDRQRRARQELISKMNQRDSSKKNNIKKVIKRKLAPSIALLMIIGVST